MMTLSISRQLFIKLTIDSENNLDKLNFGQRKSSEGEKEEGNPKGNAAHMSQHLLLRTTPFQSTGTSTQKTLSGGTRNAGVRGNKKHYFITVPDIN